MAATDILPERIFVPRRAERSLLGLCAAGIVAGTLLLLLGIALFGGPGDDQPSAALNLTPWTADTASPKPVSARQSTPGGKTAAAANTILTKLFAG